MGFFESLEEAKKVGAIYVEYATLSEVKKWPRNPKLHDDKGIQESMARFGYTEPIMIDERSGMLVAGHGRIENLMTLKDKGEAPPERIFEHDGEWYVPIIRGVRFNSDTEAEAYGLASNKLVENGGYDEELVAEILKDHAETLGPGAFKGTGFSEKEVDEIIEKANKEQSDGSLLSVVDVAIAEPSHVVEKGDVWYLGPHVLICVEVMTDWQSWKVFLDDENAIFAPYCGPFVPLGEIASKKKLVMVQPDPYIAGHVIDRYAEVHGEEAVKHG